MVEARDNEVCNITNALQINCVCGPGYMPKLYGNYILYKVGKSEIFLTVT